MRIMTGAGAVALAAGLLTSCGTAATTGSTGPAGSTPATGSSQPANPVTVVRLTGCPVPAGEVNGTVGLDADRVANCTFPGTFGEEVFVFTYPSVAYRDNRLAHPLAPPQDYESVIKGPDASLILVDRSPGLTGPTPQQIATRVGGTLLP